MGDSIVVDTGVHQRFDFRKRQLTAMGNGAKALRDLPDLLVSKSVKPRVPAGDRKLFSAVGKCWVVARKQVFTTRARVLALQPAGAWVVFEEVFDGQRNRQSVTNVHEVTVSEAARFVHDVCPDILDAADWEQKIQQITEQPAASAGYSAKTG